MAVRQVGEFELIAQCFAPLAAAESGALGLLDDAAVLEIPAGDRLVVTTDALVAGIHFLAEPDPRDVANKALRVNLSDLAAMGAKPRGFTLALALPRGFDLAWVVAFAQELGEDQKRFGVTLIGGDTVATTGPLSLTITALGTVHGKAFLPRSAAREGESVWVSGTIGDAALGLRAVRGELAGVDRSDLDFLGERYHRPTPRLALGQAIAGVASAAADVSDGLVADLGHICETSRLGAEIFAERIPLSAAASRALAATGIDVRGLWSAGDDYELVFTAPERGDERILAAAREAATPVCKIGRMIAAGEGGVTVRDARGEAVTMASRGHTHF